MFVRKNRTFQGTKNKERTDDDGQTKPFLRKRIGDLIYVLIFEG